MKLQKLIVPITAGLCAFAVCNTRAALTNIVTFSATSFTQGATNDNGTTTTFAAPITQSHNTAQIIQQLGGDTGNSFTPAAKLVLITGSDHAQFAVIDGAKFVDVSSIMNVSFGDNQILAGTQNDAHNQLASPTRKELEIIKLTFDDSGVINSGNTAPLTFSLRGLATATRTDTTPVSGVYTETFKAKITSMTGEGSGSGGPFVATGSMSISGKGILSTN